MENMLRSGDKKCIKINDSSIFINGLKCFISFFVHISSLQFVELSWGVFPDLERQKHPSEEAAWLLSIRLEFYSLKPYFQSQLLSCYTLALGIKT